MSAVGRQDTTRLQGIRVPCYPVQIGEQLHCEPGPVPGSQSTGNSRGRRNDDDKATHLGSDRSRPHDADSRRRGSKARGRRGSQWRRTRSDGRRTGWGERRSRRPVPRSAWLPARPKPPSIGKPRGGPNTRRALHTRMLRARISIQHLRRCSSPVHRLQRRPHRLRLRQRLQRQHSAARPSFARMASPWLGSPIPRIGSRSPETAMSPPSVRMDKLTR